LATPNGFFALPRTLWLERSAAVAWATIGWEASTSSPLSAVASGAAGAAGSGVVASASGTAASAATKRIATGQRRRWTSWRQRLVIELIGLQ
jgi:hypothetical protein